MHLQHSVACSGDSRLPRTEQKLVESGFDLNLFKCPAERELAVRELDRIENSLLVKRFGMTPAWIIGDSGPFIRANGLQKLIEAFELGEKLGIDTILWMVEYTSVEVINLRGRLWRRLRILEQESRNREMQTRMIENEIARTVACCVYN